MTTQRRQGGITRKGLPGLSLVGLGAYTTQQCQRINLLRAEQREELVDQARGSPRHMERSGCAPGGSAPGCFTIAHPLVLANVMHECTYRTLASHADTCRLDFYEIGRACAFHKGNFLAPLCGGGRMVGARSFINSIPPTAPPCICSTSTTRFVIVAAMALMVPRGDSIGQNDRQPLSPSPDAARPDEMSAAA